MKKEPYQNFTCFYTQNAEAMGEFQDTQKKQKGELIATKIT